MASRPSDDTGTQEVVEDISSSNVMNKYRDAAIIVDLGLRNVIESCVPESKISEICAASDEFLKRELSKVYCKMEKGQKISRGIAFPTCICINEVCCNYSPLIEGSDKSEKNDNLRSFLKAGDLVKLDLGVHIDGYIAVGGHSYIVPDIKDDIEKPLAKGHIAKCIHACWNASEIALRMIKVGVTNSHITKLIELVCAEYGCSAVSGIQSPEMKRYIIEGSRGISNKSSVDQKVEKFQFGVNEVYAVNIMVSTGEGKPREAGARTTIYRRALEVNYQPRTQNARAVLNEINKNFVALPFHIRSLEDEKGSRLGISDCSRNNIIEPYPVLSERANEFVARFKFTVLLTANGAKKICGLPFSQSSRIVADKEILNEDLNVILKAPTSNHTRKRQERRALKVSVVSGDGLQN